ncbi:hypothetical protein [Bdellovibrio sp. HCB2-146]|uniref:hypothetical protein n=1 Tax=Bdellovibrio sp. HCB2-146 TaxID=3394362 RepID=UPI0039BD30A5
MIIRGVYLLLSLILSSVVMFIANIGTRFAAVIVFFLAIIGSGSIFAAGPFSDVKKYDLSSVFDYQTFLELDLESEKLWNQLVIESGSPQAALEKMYNSSAPDPRLVLLHENVLQVISSSQHNDFKIFDYHEQKPSFDYAYKVGRKMHPLLRDVVSNVRSFVTTKLQSILASGRVRGFVLKRPFQEVNTEIKLCAFLGKCFHSEKYTEMDRRVYRTWVYTDVIYAFDLADWNCDRYLNAGAAYEDLIHANSGSGLGKLDPRSRRGVFEMVLTNLCKNQEDFVTPGTSVSRGNKFLSQTKLLD